MVREKNKSESEWRVDDGQDRMETPLAGKEVTAPALLGWKCIFDEKRIVFIDFFAAGFFVSQLTLALDSLSRFLSL